MAWARRKDVNHRLIVEAFEAHGWTVLDTSRAPYCPDFFASKKGRVVAIEVKAPGKKPKPHQERFGSSWQAEYYVLTHADQVAEITDALPSGPLQPSGPAQSVDRR